jgi:predicted nucleotidyltransferase
MASTVKILTEKKLAHPPKFLPDNVHYECIMGSVAYGTSSDTSDMDLYGFCIPPREYLFPHLVGYVEGFGTKQTFEQYQQHHINDKDALGGKGRMYDATIFNITKYFSLLMAGNPNVVDSLFVPLNCVLHSTQVGNLVRENRRLFLHKGCFQKFLGYSHSQLHKMSIKNPDEGSKRAADVEKHGFDTKFAMHLLRLAYECEQILTVGDLDLQRDREHLKAVRRGEIPEKEIREWFAAKEKTLEQMYRDSKLPHGPDEGKIKNLLLSCLESHYGSLDKLGYVNPDAAQVALREISAVVEKHRHLIAG